MLKLFFGDSAVVKAIERATSEFLLSPDWAANMEVCDLIIENKDYASDAIKTFRKRMQKSNPKISLLTLNCLECSMKNTNARFHSFVGSREFMSDMEKMARNDKLNSEVREKVLSLIEAWGIAFEGVRADFPHIVETYLRLRSSGIEFPPRDFDAMAPIFTPPATHPTVEQLRRQQQEEFLRENPRDLYNSDQFNEVAPARGNRRNRNDDIATLKHEITIVMAEVDLLKTMLMSLSVEDRKPDQLDANEAIQDLLSNLNEVCPRLNQIIPNVIDEALLAELLNVNDTVQSVLEEYEMLRGVVDTTSEHVNVHVNALSPESLLLYPEGVVNQNNNNSSSLSSCNNNSIEIPRQVNSCDRFLGVLMASEGNNSSSHDVRVDAGASGTPSIPVSVHPSNDFAFIDANNEDNEFAMLASRRQEGRPPMVSNPQALQPPPYEHVLSSKTTSMTLEARPVASPVLDFPSVPQQSRNVNQPSVDIDELFGMLDTSVKPASERMMA